MRLKDTTAMLKERRGTRRGGSKYHAVKTSCGLHEHASKKEARRCGELRLIEQMGEIKGLIQQPEFDLCGVKYRADFQYLERTAGAWRVVVEDVKGYKTEVYRIKRTLMRTVLGIEIRET